MKKFTFLKSLIIFLLVTGSISLQATNIKISNEKTKLIIKSKTDLKLVLSNIVGKINLSSMQVGNTNYSILNTPTYSKTDKIGYPSLPVLRKLIEVPQSAEPKVKVLSYELKEYKLSDMGIEDLVYPCQGPQAKCGDDEDFKIDHDIYQTNAFIKEELVSINTIGTLRSQRLGLINISPFEYNPVTNIIRVYENLEFEIVFENADLALTEELKQKYYSPFFTGMQKSILNYIPLSQRENLTQYPVKYVIVSHPMFSENIQSFIEWKKQKGFTVVEAYTDVIGTTTDAIKTYLQGLYDNGTVDDPAPSFVLFVGDIDQMPTWNNGNGVTDRNYVEYTGDLLPEIFYGRMSAETTDQLDIIIAKTLQYEQYTMPDPTYLDEVVMVAGMDGSHGADWGNGQINYGTENYFNEDHGIFSQTYLYPESGNNSAQIQQDISDGVTFANYTAHCSPNGWADPSFVINDIPALENEDKYGLLIGNCCSSSEYQTTCFAEEIVRAENKGAVGYIGGSNSTYWDEDYYFGVGVGAITEDPPSYDETTLGNYDRSFHDHGEDFGEWYTTMDQIIFAGNLAVLEGSPGSAEYYWDIYNLIGDPSLMIYYSIPDVMPVSHDGFITIGSTTFTVETEAYAYVALNKNSTLKAVALADENGVAILEFESFATPGNAELVITAQNRQPWIEDVLVFAPDGPFCVYESHILQDDSLGNGNAKADFDEDVFVSISLTNYGTEDANNVDVTISTSNEFVTIIDNSENYDTIFVDETASKDYGFLIKLANNIPDQMQINFTVTASDENDSTWISDFTILSYAPLLKGTEMIIDDVEGGNGNGILDPGESAVMTIKTINEGHCSIENVNASLIAFNQFITVESNDTILPTVGLFMPCFASYNISVNADAPEGVFAEMHYDLSAAGYEETTVFYPKISELIEDWETGDFSKFDWQTGGDMPWEITLEYPYEGYYHAISGEIADEEESSFQIQYEVLATDSISFYKKISSEPDYDYLKFYIDNNVKGEWSGSESWTKEVFGVDPGMHTFKWAYEKDYSQTGGVDKAWIDYISLPTMMTTTIFAGPDDESCDTNIFYCQGTATNYDTLWWSTNGTGVFNNLNIECPGYTPSEADLKELEIILTLSIIDVDGINHSDEMILNLNETPDLAYTPEGPETVDLEFVTSSNYTTETLEQANLYNWEVFPAYAGNIIGNTDSITINWNLNFEGEAWLKVAGMNDCGQGEFSDSLLIVVSNSVGIISSNLEINLNLMPNPNNGLFNISIQTTNSGNYELTVVNGMGKVIKKENLEVTGSSSKSIDLRGNAPGIYLLFIKNGNTQAMLKTIVK